MPNYIRDGRAPIPKSESVSRVMSANKGRDTGPELLLRRALHQAGVPGYRLHWKKAPGRPDIAYPGRRVAVFVHGCYWHRCPHCQPSMPKTHSRFWREKFAKNQERDERKLRELQEAGWTSIVIWECQLKNDPAAAAASVKKLLDSVAPRRKR